MGASYDQHDPKIAGILPQIDASVSKNDSTANARIVPVYSLELVQIQNQTFFTFNTER